jgi:hypothetical protein
METQHHKGVQRVSAGELSAVSNSGVWVADTADPGTFSQLQHLDLAILHPWEVVHCEFFSRTSEDDLFLSQTASASSYGAANASLFTTYGIFVMSPP